MAQRRMFSPDIIDSDAFLDMPISSQALYFHLAMRADDDGFISPKKIMRLINVRDDDLKVLLTKRFLLPFNSGVVVIKHWLIHNLIRKDRYKETRYLEEKHTLTIKANGSYTEAKNDNQMATSGLQNDNQMAPQVRLGKVRLGKVSTEEQQKILNRLILSRGQLIAYAKEFNGLTTDEIKEQREKCNAYMNMSSSNYTNPGLFFKGWLQRYVREKKLKDSEQKEARRIIDTLPVMSEDQRQQNLKRLAEMRKTLRMGVSE